MTDTIIDQNDVFERMTFANPLNEVTVQHDTHIQVYYVCGIIGEFVVSELSSKVNLDNSKVLSVQRSYGFLKEYQKEYSLGYRIAGTKLNDEDMVVVRLMKGNHIDTEWTLAVTMDTDWIDTTWERIREISKL